MYFTIIQKKKKKERNKDLTERRQVFGSGNLRIILGVLFLLSDPTIAQTITQMTKHRGQSLSLSLCAACSTIVNEVETLGAGK